VGTKTNRPGSINARLETIAGRLIIAYFDLVYRLLLGSVEGHRFIARATPPGAPAAHSYLTAADMDSLISTLGLSTGDLVVDLGCGFGEVAIAVHQRTGADVVGIEASSRALVEARRRIAAAGVEEHVRVVRADITNLPAAAGRARAAYEIDSLMFTPERWQIYSSLLRQMGPDSRIFATTLEFGPSDSERSHRRTLDLGVTVEALDDVTPELKTVNENRRHAALGLLRSRDTGLRGWLAMLAVVEETLIRREIRRGLVRR
jgi:SAM-dependent methyltransferase